MAAGDEQRGKRWNGVAMLECGSEEVPFHMMDAQQRDVAREGEGFAITDADEQRTDEARCVSDRNRVHAIETHSGFTQRAIDHGHNAGEMRA